MNKPRPQTGARYGVEITGTRLHSEANGLKQVLAELDGQVGTVRVIDRVSETVVFDGLVHEVRESIGAFFAHQEEHMDAITRELQCPKP